jgi:hypothetical protein
MWFKLDISVPNPTYFITPAQINEHSILLLGGIIKRQADPDSSQ